LINDKATTFAIIGKPNNGKSSIISTLTFDDRIAVADEIGTTKFKSKYTYKYNGKDICHFYDTPGFENAEKIYDNLENNPIDISIKKKLEKYLQDVKKEKSITSKSIEIIEAVLDCDFVVFVINISKDFNINEIGYELEILKKLSQDVIVLFNQIDKNNYKENWKKILLDEYDIKNTYTIDPLNSQYENIIKIFTSIYSKNSEKYESNQLDKVLITYRNHYKENMNETIKLISEYLKDTLAIKIDTTREKIKSKEAEYQMVDEINKKEKNVQKEINKIWGYHQVKVIDKREKYNTPINTKLKLTKKEKALISATIGAISTGTATGLLSGGLAAPAGALIGGTVGAAAGYLSDGKLYDYNILKKDAVISIDKKDMDLSMILLQRILYYTKVIINHGHANRTAIEIEKIEKVELSNYKKDIFKIHKSFVCDENTHEYLEKLNELLKDKVKEYIKYDF